MRVSRTLGCALAVLAGLTACTSTVAGTPARDVPASGGSDGLTAKAVLGDFATYDPCGLVEPSAFDDFGEAELVERQSFERCGLNLTTSANGSGTAISVGRLGQLGNHSDDAERVAELDGGLWIAQWRHDSSICPQGLVFADDVTLEVTVVASTDKSEKMCEVAEAGARMVADAVLAGRVEHLDYPENSLALVDPCELISEDTVRSRPAYADARQEPAPAGHSCGWYQVSDGAATTLDVTFSVGSLPSPGTSDEEVDIAGRQTIVSRYEGEGSMSCTVSTEHIPSEISMRAGGMELAEVNTYAPLGRESGCDSAVAVATEVWAGLPKP